MYISRISFTIGETEIPNIFQEEQKFLGKFLFPTGKLSDAFDYIKSELETKLLNINALLIQDEYKVWIYETLFHSFYSISAHCSYNIAKSSEETRYIH